MNDNIQKLYGALQKYGYDDLGTAEEFGAKVQDDSSRRKLYDAMSRDGFDDLGTYEEFSGKLVQTASPQPVQAAEPVQTEAQKRTDQFNAMARRHDEANGAATGVEDEATEAWAKSVAGRGRGNRREERHEELEQMVGERRANENAQKLAAREEKAFEAAEGLEMFNEMRRKKGVVSAGEQAAELTKDQPEPLGANVEGKTAEELDQIKHSMGIEKSFTEEYEKRRAEYAEHMKEYASVRGDARNVDFSKYEEEREWLKKNEAKYNDMKGRLDNVQSRYLELTTPDAMAQLDEAQKENRSQMASVPDQIAMGYNAFGGSYVGRTDESMENARRMKADEIYNMARQTLNQGSKYDKGYEGSGMEQAATAISQFIKGGINNVDKGSLTMGLSEGMALMEARKVGDKYNGIITGTVKDLGYTDRDVTKMMGEMEKKTKELEPVAQELERSRAEIDVMQATLDEMIANGDDESKVRSYAKELNKQINAYNKKVKDSESLFADYKKTRDQYDELTSAVEAALQSGLTGGEQAILDAVQQYTKAQYLRSDDVSKAAAAGAGLEDTLEFMLGFILTGGLEKAGTKAATKLTMRHLEKKLGKEGLKELAAKAPIKASLGYKALTDVGVAGARTLALAPRNIQTYGEQLAEYADVDNLGRLQFNRSKLNAAANTLFTNFVENWSEGFGEYLSAGEQKLFRLATGNAPKMAIGKTLQSYRGSIGNYLDHGKFDGLFNEMMEEVGGSGLNWFAGWLSSDRNDEEDRGKIGDRKALSEFFAGDQLATTFLSFLPLSAIGAATNISAYNKMARRYDESVAKLNPLIESGALDIQELDNLANGISGMTPVQAKNKVIDLADKARKKNGGELPKDFAPAVMGYLEGKYAMDLRHDEWEDSKEKMAVVGAYSTAYDQQNVRDAWDMRQAEQETRAAASEAGFTDEELDRDAWVLAQDAASIRETEPERSQVLLDYATAKGARAGLVNGYRDAGRAAEEEFDAAVRQNLSRDGIVISAQVQENGQPKTVYITTKGVKINNDGTVSTPTGVDGPILYRDSATGEQKKVMASQLTGAEIFETENFIREENEADADVRARAFEAAEKTVSLGGRARAINANVGNNVVVRRNGVYAPVKIERMTNGGLGVVISGDKKALQGIAAAMGMQVPASQYIEAPVAQFYDLLSKEQDGSLTTFNEEQGQAQAPVQGTQGTQTQAVEETPEVEIKPNDKFTVNYKGAPRQVDVDQANDTEVWFSYTDENGNQNTGFMTPYEFRESIVPEGAPAQEAAPAAAQAPAPAQAQARAAFPVDEKGNRIYDDPSVSPQAAYDEIYNGVEAGSKNEANRNKFVAAKAAKAAKDVEDAKNRIAGLQARKDAVDQWELPDNEELDAFENRKAEEKKKFDDEIAQIEAGLPELERKAAHWNGVQTMASQRTQPAPAQAAPAPAAQKRKPKMSKRARVARAKQWEKRTGVKVKIATTPGEVTDKTARAELEKGEIVYGWFDKDTNTIGLYLPYLTDEEEIDKTFIHEVISHRGLRELLGEEEYNKLCDRVWNELMSEQDQKDWLDYNSHLQGRTEEFLRRAAADEFIANLSEDLDLADNRNIFEKFVDWVKEIFDRVLPRTSEQIAAEAAGIVAKESISRADLFDLLRDSLSNYEAVLRAEKKRAEAKPLTTESLPENIQEGLKEQGKVMEGGTVMDEQQAALKEATGYKTPNEKDMASNSVVGDVRMSKETMPAWKRNYMTYPEAKEHVVKVLENLMERMSADQLVNNVVPGGVYKYGEKTSGSKAGPLRTNIEYIVTFDMDTSCPRSLQYLEYVKKIEAQIGRPLTQTEMIQLIEMMRVYGQMIPCVYCYCENKRQALKQYYHDYMTARQGVINAKTEEEALAAMYGHETTKAARESKDPKVALTEAAYKVFTRWRSGDVKYNPSLKQLWQQYRNDRNVILTVLDQLLDNKKITTFMTDETIAGHLCKDLRIEDKLAKKAAEDLVGEWKWNRIENRPHDDFKRIEDEDDLVVGQETLALWREMTAYGRSASQAKNVLRYVPYTDELKTLSQKDRDYINGMGGLRMHSSNDFRIDYVLDYFQFMADMAVNHMYGHTYTKSPEFVRIFGNSGYKINMSIAAVEDANGIHPNSQEGFDWDEARELREKFPNAGVMLMATSDAQVQMALDSDWIDMFIPFHASGLPKAVWYDMRQWTDYSSIQNERFLNGDEMKAALAEDGVVVPKGTSAEEVEQMYIDHFNIHVARYTTGKKAGKRISPHFLPGKTIVDGVEIPGHNNDYETYIRLCREWGVHPRFYGLKVKDNTPEGGGREVDITEHPAYMKCIKETARTDTPQTAIEFNFDQPSEALGGKTPIDYALEELQNRAAAEAQAAGGPVRNIYESYKQDPYGIVPQFINTIIKHKETTGKDYPLDYLTPDSRKWAMEERKALEAAYKEFDTIPYHPHVYDADGNLIMEPEAETQPAVESDGSYTMLRKVTDPAIIDWFNNAPKTTGFRTVAKKAEDTFGSPMAGQLGQTKGKGRVATSSFNMNEIEQSEENPDIADENGKVKLIKPKRDDGKKLTDVGSVDYNPYIHLRLDKINRQFKDAWKRDDLVYIESEVPVEEVPDFRGQKEPDYSKSPYHAEKAALPVGIHDWNGGALMLSRYDRPIREVPWEEVADAWAADKDFQKNGVHFDIVPPQMRDLLTERGIKIIEPHKGMGQDCIDAYNAWKNRDNGPDGGTRFRKANQAQLGLVSNAGAALDRIKMEKATPEQWVKMLEKEGGLKAGEDKWIGLSDWLKSQDKKSLTKDEIDDYINEHKIVLAESTYTNEDPNQLMARKDPEAAEAFDYTESSWADRVIADIKDTEKAVALYNRDNPDNQVTVGPHGEMTPETRDKVLEYAEDLYSAQADVNRINSIRLGYTTEGLDNKREIALVVPTIESWNEDDNIHFGDAGNGRAVAWVRFGETTTPNPAIPYAEEKYREARKALNEFRDGLKDKYSDSDKPYFEACTPEEIAELASLKDRETELYNELEALLSNRPRVLVIDEIQSKRHQEGREKGYKSIDGIDLRKKQAEAKAAYDEYIDSLKEKYGGYEGIMAAGGLTDEENQRAEELNDAYIAASNAADKEEGGIAPAPFERNWHELAMKRMLRLAAEEGYDYVAWTTGEQQADRYNIGRVVDSIKKPWKSNNENEQDFEVKSAGGNIYLTTDNEGKIIKSLGGGQDFKGQTLSELFGKDIAVKMLTMKENDTIEGDGFRVGGEGMKGFYDDILPRFMNKYGKKWGVKVQDITLPNVEEAGRVMHAVPVTQEMKDSVMEGQTMFRKAPNGRQSNLTDEQWEMVRTPEFKAWFGDWENDPANASKVVDENGEPMVVYHGTRWDPMSEEPGEAVFKSGWFTGIKQRADGYGEPVSVFLDIKNPIPEDVASNFPGLDLNDPSTFGDYDGYISYIDYGENRKLSPIAVRRLKAFYPDRYEQLIEEETAKLPTGRKMFSIIPRDPSQIKSATNNNGQFDPNNPDIRFRKSTITPEQDKEYMDAVNAGDMEKAQQMVDDAAKAAGYNIKAYHGTTSENGERPFNTINDGHFTDDRDFAVYYADQGAILGDDVKPYVFTTFIKMENPLEYDFKGQNSDYAVDENGKRMTTYSVFDRAKEDGHDGVILYNVDEYGDGVEEEDGYYPNTVTDYIPVSPNQIKSAAAVERDDAGNVIPLSERFNPENNDIRFRRAAPMTGEQRQEKRIADAGREATVQAFGTMPAVIKSGVNGVSRDRMPAGHKTDKGYYNPEENNVYVCMDNVADERDAVATVVHETVGYKGLQELLGDRFNDMMTGVYAALDNEGRTWVNAYIARNGLRPGDGAIVRGMEEYLASTAERDGGSAIENVNEVLSKFVGDLFGVADFSFTDRELAYVLRASYEHSVNPGWLDTPVGRAKDTLMKRELGINETDPNKPTDPDGGTRFRKNSTGTAAQQYKDELEDWRNKMIIENQNADLPVKIGMQKAMQEVYGDKWEEKMKSLPESQDYLMRHNQSSSRADTEAHNFMLFHYAPMIDKVKEIQKLIAGEKAKRGDLRDAYQRVLDYMYAVSGLERNEWERANGGEQKDWSGITSLMGYEDKGQWQQAEADAKDMVEQFRKDVMNAVRKDGKTEAEAYADADAVLNDLWNLVQSCTDFSLDHAFKYGLLTRDEYERLRGTASKPRLWNRYLPLRGFKEKTAEDVFGYSDLAGEGGGDVVEHAKGRWTEADNPLANILNIAQREIVHGNENWARQALLNFTINLGKNSLLSERNPWYVKVPGTKKWQLAYPEPIVDPATNEQKGTESIEDFEARMQELKANGDARQGRKGLKIDQIMSNKGHRNQHLVHVKVGGSDRMIWVNGNPALAKAVSGYGRKASWQAWRNASRVLSNLFTTYSLDFTAKNLIRDSIYSRVALLMKEDQNYRWHFLKNWWNNFGYGAFAFPMIRLAAEWDSGKLQRKQNLTDRERMFIEFMHDGGQTGYTVVRSVEKLKKDLEKTMAPRIGKKVVDAMKIDVRGVEVPILGIFSWGVRTLNEAFELLTRFTTYQTSREMGRTGQRAAYDAKEISVNFNRKGAQSNEGVWGQMAAFLGGTHYFYNAGVQGFDNFLRLYKAAPVKMGVTSALIMGMGLTIPFINSMLAGIGSGGDDGGDDDWYWNLPEWVRRNNIILGWKSKEKTDENGTVKNGNEFSYLALPLPVEFRAIYGLGDIAAAAFAYQKMPNRTFGRVAGDIISTTAAILPFNPIENYTAGGNAVDAAVRAVAPDIIMPAIDYITNRDYTGRALMKENPFTHVVPKNQGAYASTPKALVDACQWLGETAGIDLAPGVVRDVLSNYAGGYYRFAEDIAKQMFTDVDHPRRWDDIPFLSGFTGHLDEDRSNTYVSGVLNEYKRLSQKTVLKMNLYNSSDDITEKIAYETPELLPDKANVQRILSGRSYELGKMYYFGMKDKGTGEYHKVEKVHKSGKSAGKRYSVKEEIKIPGVETLKKRWKDAREYWASLPKGSPEAAEAYKDVTNAWHEYYNAQADLADKLMNYEYGK